MSLGICKQEGDNKGPSAELLDTTECMHHENIPI